MENPESRERKKVEKVSVSITSGSTKYFNISRTEIIETSEAGHKPKKISGEILSKSFPNLIKNCNP